MASHARWVILVAMAAPLSVLGQTPDSEIAADFSCPYAELPPDSRTESSILWFTGALSIAASRQLAGRPVYQSEYWVPSSPILSEPLRTSKMPGSDWLTL